MLKQSLLSPFILLFILQGALGQDNNNSPYKFSSEIFDHIHKDSNYLNSSAPTDLSFIGLYRDALIQYDKPRHGCRIISAKDSADFLSYHPVGARQFIIEKAKKNQVLIFNEAHHNPRNGVFVTSLLKDLRDLGYKYFAAETFVNDSFFAKEKHPNFFTGYYSVEPQFGNLIREALTLNYSLFPYEAVPPANGKQREIQEAKNLQLLLQKDPKAKVIVYCGYDHIIEDSLPGWGKAMAGRLKEWMQAHKPK